MSEALLRPLEITAANNSIVVTYLTGTSYSLAVGVYPSVLSVLYALEANLKLKSAAFAVSLTSDWKVFIDGAGVGGAFDLEWTDPELGKMLGFDQDYAGVTSATATYTPEFCFLPTYHSYDGGRFSANQSDGFSGEVSIDGSLAGVRAGIPRLERRVQWSTLPAAKVFKEAATLTSTFSTTHYPEQLRCFEHFAQEARNVTTTSGSTSAKGCYFLPDAASWTGAAPTNDLPSTMTAGSERFNLAASPSTYLFCHLDPRGPREPKQRISSSAAYYDVELLLRSAEIPSAGWVV